jgi:ATP-dependent helicase/nuclease subunit B
LLWAGEEGDALATMLGEIQAALPMLPDQRRSVLPGLLDAVLQGQVVRSRRALRGRGGTEHPRVFIWGLLEARLQTADTLVLGGLVEGVWPPATDPGPWLSRPMRARVGLASPEQAVGQAAHDFLSAANAAPHVVLSGPARRDGAPAVPARWLTRLEVLLAGHGQSLPQHPAVAWVRALDQPVDRPRPAAPPRPCPPVVLRPRRLSVTEIETWLRDPYAIYARHVLKLNALKPLDEATDAADYGALVHAGMRHFLVEHDTRWPPGAAGHLRRAMARALAEAGLREALAAWWAPRLDRIADWVAEVEATRRAVHRIAAIEAEVKGTSELPRDGGRFALVGRADRIERRADGTLAILDYKTGTPPSQKEVDAGLAPQLLLEAAMAESGAFGAELAGQAGELIYWHLTGGYDPGEVRSLFKGDSEAIAAAVAAARESLGALIDAYDQPDRCYLSQPHPARAPRFSDYAQLARVAEWAAAGEEA